jgi:hypothetical protein
VLLSKGSHCSTITRFSWLAFKGKTLEQLKTDLQIKSLQPQSQPDSRRGNQDPSSGLSAVFPSSDSAGRALPLLLGENRQLDRFPFHTEEIEIPKF